MRSGRRGCRVFSVLDAGHQLTEGLGQIVQRHGALRRAQVFIQALLALRAQQVVDGSKKALAAFIRIQKDDGLGQLSILAENVLVQLNLKAGTGFSGDQAVTSLLTVALWVA